jgi:uncharacterized protein (TIGR01777 family)
MSERPEILVTGATGLIGARLLRALDRDGLAARALTRRPDGAPPLAAPHRWIGWDGRNAPAEAVAGAVGIVHLAGEPVWGGILTAARRERIRESRLASTRSLVAEIGRLPPAQRPRLLLSASGVGYYADGGDGILDEGSAPGEDFLAVLCRDWETEARAAAQHGVRCLALRIGVVLAREGGALPKMALPFRFGLGGRLGDGRQWVPWIHADDVVSLILAALGDDAWTGPVNAVAPQPVRNRELTRELARALHRPALLPIPAFALRAALGEFSGQLLDSRRCAPQAALARGFAFAHTEVASALAAELA